MKFICHPRVSVELIFGCAHESGLCPWVGRSVLCCVYAMTGWRLKGRVSGDNSFLHSFCFIRTSIVKIVALDILCNYWANLGLSGMFIGRGPY